MMKSGNFLVFRLHLFQKQYFYFTRTQLRDYREYLDKKHMEQQRQANITKLEEEAKKTHYLVSTKVVPGIYNSKYLE